MSITHAELVEKLESLDLTVIVPPDQDQHVEILFSTDRYRDPEGQPSLLVVCRVGDDGWYLEVFAPGAYASRNCRFKGSLFAALLEMSWRTKSIQAEYDPSDGEIRFACDLLVEDATVTPRQLLRLLRTLVGIIEDFHPVISHVFETGKLDMSLLPKPPQDDGASPEMLGLLEELGGINELRRIVEERRTRPGGRPA